MRSVSLVAFAILLAGVAPLGAGSAMAAPTGASPFAGTYLGDVPTVPMPYLYPGQYWWGWSATISKKGAVQGGYAYAHYTYDEYSGDTYSYESTGSFSGSVDADGNLSISGSQTYTTRVRHYRSHRWETLGTNTWSTFAINASVVKDANGDLVATDNASGESAVWTRTG